MLARLSSVVLLVVATAAAQEFRQIDTPGFSFGCYDPVRERVVAPGIGGYSVEWDGAVWRRAPDPGARRGFSYVDLQTSRLTTVERLFQGAGFTMNFYQRHGNAWQFVPTPGAPPVRNGMALCYDAARRELLAFGGYSPVTMTPFGDTWIWDGTTWSQRAVSGPAPRSEVTVAYNSVRQRVVLFGGYDQPFASTFDDTWQWDGVAWQRLPTQNHPPRRQRAQAAFDLARDRVVMLVQVDAPGFPIEHWEYDGIDWSQSTAPLPASVSAQTVVVHDEARGETLLLGGTNGIGVHGEVWAWNGSTWAPRPGFGIQPWQSFGSEVAPHPNGTDIYLFGRYEGAGPLPGLVDELWTFDGTVWSLAATGGPGGRQDPVFWTMGGDSYLFGGFAYSANELVDDVWRWDGTVWTQLSPAIRPAPRSRAAWSVDLMTNRLVMFGGLLGQNWSDETWTFDGSQWSLASAGPGPSPRYWSAMAYDEARDRTVLHGGLFSATPLHDTWEWNGLGWAQVVTTRSPPPRGRMTYDRHGQRVLYFAAGPASSNRYEVWAFDGVDWTLVPMFGTAGSGNPLRASLPRPVSIGDDVFVLDQSSGMHALLRTPARVSYFGSACGNDAPGIAAASLPQLADASFAIDVTGAGANAPVAIAAAASSASTPLFGCDLLVTRSIATLFLTASATGHAIYPLSIPNQPALVGTRSFFQAATLTPSNANGFALSAGLQVEVGR